jgi:hypothetical protein
MAGAIDGWDADKPAGTDYIDASDEMIRANWAAIEVMAGALQQNLEIKNGASAATQVDVSADRIALFDTSSPPLCFAARSVNFTADIEATPGPNGPESATLEAADKWIFIWVIYNPGTDTTASLFSAASDWSNVVKTDIGGYTFSRLVGAVYNDSSGDLVDFIQRGKRVSYKASVQIITNGRSDAAWSSPVDLSAYVPSIAKRISGYAALTHTAGTGNYQVAIEFAADNSGNYPGTRIEDLLLASGGIVYTSSYFEQELTAQQISYKTEENGATVSANVYLQNFHIEI